MYPTITSSAIFVLVLSQLSTALPQVQNGQLSRRQSDGAKDGCHPLDFIKALQLVEPIEGVGEDNNGEQDAANKVEAQCKDQCWPLSSTDKGAHWDAQGCSVSPFPYIGPKVPARRLVQWNQRYVEVLRC